MLRKRFILLIHRNKVVVFGGGNQVVAEVAWQNDDLRPAFKHVVTKLKSKNVSVVFGDELSYVYSTKTSSRIDRNKLFDEVSGVVPEEISQRYMLTREIVLDKKGSRVVEAIVLPNLVLKAMVVASSESGLKINLAVPMPELVYHQYRPRIGNVLIVLSVLAKGVFVLGPNGVLLAKSAVTNLEKKLQDAIAEVNSVFGVKLNGVVIDSKQLFPQVSAIPNAKPVVKSLDLGSALRSVEKSESALKFGDSLFESGVNTMEEEEKEAGKEGRGKLFVAIVFVVVLVASGFGAFYFLNGKSQPEEGSQTLSADSSPAASPGPTSAQQVEAVPAEQPEVVDNSVLRVQILNGSGVPGAAGDVAELLTPVGFGTVDVENASGTDFSGITLSASDKVPEGTFEQIKDALGEDYEEIINGEDLEVDSAYDLVIIVGS